MFFFITLSVVLNVVVGEKFCPSYLKVECTPDMPADCGFVIRPHPLGCANLEPTCPQFCRPPGLPHEDPCKGIDCGPCQKCVATSKFWCEEPPCANHECQADPVCEEKCKDVECPEGFVCHDDRITHRINCLRPADKPGLCPANHILHEPCSGDRAHWCDSDWDCYGDSKCCPRGCNSICHIPVFE